MPAKIATTTSQLTSKRSTPLKPPMCYFCSSTDTMIPFLRDSRIFVLSSLVSRLRWRYCRHCRRHFLHIAPAVAQARPGPNVTFPPRDAR